MAATPVASSLLRSEVSTPCAEAFDDEHWRFSVDWDGARALLFIDEAGTVRAQTEALDDVTPSLPELRGAPRHLSGEPAVLDGTLVVLDAQGRPDLESLCLRFALGKEGVSPLPVVFLATDALFAGNALTTSWPLHRRLELLRRLVTRDGVVQAPETVAGRGHGLAEAAGDRGLHAVLARREAAAYRPGATSPDRLRIALRQRADCVVAGVEEGTDRPYLVLAEYDAGRLVFSGRVKGPRHTAMERWLADEAARVATPEPQLRGGRGHRFVRAGDIIWLRPRLIATVSHRGRLADGLLREPSLVAVRSDVDPRGCVRRAPVPPPAPPEPRLFAPTVLLPLPLDDGTLIPSTGR